LVRLRVPPLFLTSFSKLRGRTTCSLPPPMDPPSCSDRPPPCVSSLNLPQFVSFLRESLIASVDPTIEGSSSPKKTFSILCAFFPGDLDVCFPLSWFPSLFNASLPPQVTFLYPSAVSFPQSPPLQVCACPSLARSSPDERLFPFCKTASPAAFPPLPGFPFFPLFDTKSTSVPDIVNKTAVRSGVLPHLRASRVPRLKIT